MAFPRPLLPSSNPFQSPGIRPTEKEPGSSIITWPHRTPVFFDTVMPASQGSYEGSVRYPRQVPVPPPIHAVWHCCPRTGTWWERETARGLGAAVWKAQESLCTETTPTPSALCCHHPPHSHPPLSLRFTWSARTRSPDTCILTSLSPPRMLASWACTCAPKPALSVWYLSSVVTSQREN